MKKRFFICAAIICILSAICTGCAAMITMPYGSEEYESGKWTVMELVDHFQELGFTNIDTSNINQTFTKEFARVDEVVIEDNSTDSWFAEYRKFEKGETFTDQYEIRISGYEYIPTLGKDNSSDFLELLEGERTSTELEAAIDSFMKAHDGEYLEFDGTITTWDDKNFWVGIWFAVAVEDDAEISFSWEDISTLELEEVGNFNHSTYEQGEVCAGKQVHMIVKINSNNNGWKLEIQSIYVKK